MPGGADGFGPYSVPGGGVGLPGGDDLDDEVVAPNAERGGVGGNTCGGAVSDLRDQRAAEPLQAHELRDRQIDQPKGRRPIVPDAG